MTWYIKGFREQVDAWVGFHLFGPYVLADLFGAWWVGVVAAFIWECLDVAWCLYVRGSGTFKAIRSNVTGEFYLEPHFMDKVFDRRGFSIVDLALGCIGVLAWVIKSGC